MSDSTCPDGRMLNPDALGDLQPVRRRPWQLEMTSYSEDVEMFDQAAIHDLTRMFEYAPEMSSITIKTAKGDIFVRQVFPWDSVKTADNSLASFFKYSPTATGVVFGSGEKGHMATRDAPYTLSAGKAYADARAAFMAGHITSEEMRRLLGAMRQG